MQHLIIVITLFRFDYEVGKVNVFNGVSLQKISFEMTMLKPHNFIVYFCPKVPSGIIMVYVTIIVPPM